MPRPTSAKGKRISKREPVCQNCGSTGPFYDYLVCNICAKSSPEVFKSRQTAAKSARKAAKVSPASPTTFEASEGLKKHHRA